MFWLNLFLNLAYLSTLTVGSEVFPATRITISPRGGSLVKKSTNSFRVPLWQTAEASWQASVATHRKSSSGVHWIARRVVTHVLFLLEGSLRKQTCRKAVLSLLMLEQKLLLPVMSQLGYCVAYIPLKAGIQDRLFQVCQHRSPAPNLLRLQALRWLPLLLRVFKISHRSGHHVKLSCHNNIV